MSLVQEIVEIQNSIEKNLAYLGTVRNIDINGSPRRAKKEWLKKYQIFKKLNCVVCLIHQTLYVLPLDEKQEHTIKNQWKRDLCPRVTERINYVPIVMLTNKSHRQRIWLFKEGDLQANC